jgi:catechol 1,2-dioxygenase
MSSNPLHAELLAEVLARYDASPNPRLKEIMQAAVRHLHAFVEEVGLTHDEWMRGIRFLTETGKICDDVRQEWILLSDTLGVSTLVEFITQDAGAGATENTVLGPFFVPDSPERAFGESTLVDDDAGERVVIRGRVTDLDGTPVAGARIDVWQNNTAGFYACQQPGVQSSENLRGVFRTRDDGTYEFRTVRPVPYPIPDDGPAGALLKANGRDWMRAAHVHVWVTAPGYKDLITHVFDRQSAHLDDDAVFGVRPSLVRDFVPSENGENGELAATFDIMLERT